MRDQEASPSFSTNNQEKHTTREGHYYVQALTSHIFLVRECLSTNSKPGADDTIIRSFDVCYDADSYADSLNQQKRQNRNQ
jgi:hypothetical protein